MVLTYTWQTREWREAYLLCTGTKQRPRAPVPMGVLVAIVMLLGGVGDLYTSFKRSTGVILHDRLMPVLLFVCAFVLLSASAGLLLRFLQQLRGVPPMPHNEQRATFHERGWTTIATGDGAVTTEWLWAELIEYRRGRSVLVLLTSDGAPLGVPLRVLTPDQDGWLLALIDRKASKRDAACRRLN